MWKDLKQVMKPTNIPDVKLFCTDEWAKTSPSGHAGLINTYQACLFAYFCHSQIRNIGSMTKYNIFVSFAYLWFLCQLLILV